MYAYSVLCARVASLSDGCSQFWKTRGNVGLSVPFCSGSVKPWLCLCNERCLLTLGVGVRRGECELRARPALGTSVLLKRSHKRPELVRNGAGPETDRSVPRWPVSGLFISRLGSRRRVRPTSAHFCPPLFAFRVWGMHRPGRAHFGPLRLTSAHCVPLQSMLLALRPLDNTLGGRLPNELKGNGPTLAHRSGLAHPGEHAWRSRRPGIAARCIERPIGGTVDFRLQTLQSKDAVLHPREKTTPIREFNFGFFALRVVVVGLPPP